MRYALCEYNTAFMGRLRVKGGTNEPDKKVSGYVVVYS